MEPTDTENISNEFIIEQTDDDSKINLEETMGIPNSEKAQNSLVAEGLNLKVKGKDLRQYVDLKDSQNNTSCNAFIVMITGKLGLNTYTGTGTLAKIKGKVVILTAAHCTTQQELSVSKS